MFKSIFKSKAKFPYILNADYHAYFTVCYEG